MFGEVNCSIFFSFGLEERLEFERCRLEEDNEHPKAGFVIIEEWFNEKCAKRERYIIKAVNVQAIAHCDCCQSGSYNL